MLNKFRSSISNITSQSKRSMCMKKRKYPINPEDAKKLPVFDYGASKKSYNRVFVWGFVQTGATGVPYLKRGDNPAMLEHLKYPKRLGFAEKFPVTTAACGFGFTAFAVDNESNVKLYGTGLNSDSQIGYHAIRAGHPLEIIFFPQPIPLPFRNPEKSRIRKLAAGRAHLVVLSDEGLFFLGNNSYGQCSRPIVPDEDYFHSNYINHIQDINGEKIVDVECGQDHTFAVTETGSVYACGWGEEGQTGLGHFRNCSEFTKVRGDIESEKIVKISSRCDFVLALNDKGEVFGWGGTEFGQIPDKDDVQQVCHPTYLKMLEPMGKIKDVGAANSFCVVVSDSGRVFVWGFGILGAGPEKDHAARPIELPVTLFGRNDFQPESKVVKVACGLGYTLAVTNFGDIYAWGRNNRCCLGLGDKKDQYFPFRVSIGGYATDVFCGIDHSVAICKPFI